LQETKSKNPIHNSKCETISIPKSIKFVKSLYWKRKAHPQWKFVFY